MSKSGYPNLTSSASTIENQHKSFQNVLPQKRSHSGGFFADSSPPEPWQQHARFNDNKPKTPFFKQPFFSASESSASPFQPPQLNRPFLSSTSSLSSAPFSSASTTTSSFSGPTSTSTPLHNSTASHNPLNNLGSFSHRSPFPQGGGPLKVRKIGTQNSVHSQSGLHFGSDHARFGAAHHSISSSHNQNYSQSQHTGFGQQQSNASHATHPLAFTYSPSPSPTPNTSDDKLRDPRDGSPLSQLGTRNTKSANHIQSNVSSRFGHNRKSSLSHTNSFTNLSSLKEASEEGSDMASLSSSSLPSNASKLNRPPFRINAALEAEMQYDFVPPSNSISKASTARSGSQLSVNTNVEDSSEMDTSHDSFRFAKPLQTAFMSTGLLSKRNRQSLDEKMAPPDTPCKKNTGMAHHGGFSASNGMANSFGNTNNGSNNGFGLSKTGLGHRVLTNSKSKLGPFGNQNSFPSGNNTIFHPLNPKNNEISKNNSFRSSYGGNNSNDADRDIFSFNNSQSSMSLSSNLAKNSFDSTMGSANNSLISNNSNTSSNNGTSINFSGVFSNSVGLNRVNSNTSNSSTLNSNGENDQNNMDMDMGVDATPLSSNTKHQTNGFDLFARHRGSIDFNIHDGPSTPTKHGNNSNAGNNSFGSNQSFDSFSGSFNGGSFMGNTSFSSNSVQNNGAANNITGNGQSQNSVSFGSNPAPSPFGPGSINIRAGKQVSTASTITPGRYITRSTTPTSNSNNAHRMSSTSSSAMTPLPRIANKHKGFGSENINSVSSPQSPDVVMEIESPSTSNPSSKQVTPNNNRNKTINYRGAVASSFASRGFGSSTDLTSNEDDSPRTPAKNGISNTGAGDHLMIDGVGNKSTITNAGFDQNEMFNKNNGIFGNESFGNSNISGDFNSANTGNNGMNESFANNSLFANSSSVSGQISTSNDVCEDASLSAKFGRVSVAGRGQFSYVYVVTEKTEPQGNEMVANSYAVKRTKNPFVSIRERNRLHEEVEILRKLTVDYKKNNRRSLVISPSRNGDRDPRDNQLVNSSASNALDLANEDDEGREHVVNLISDWECNGYLYIMTEYCENGNLDDFLAKSGNISRLDEWRVWKILVEITLGLRYIHESGFLHLDLKPANILITFEGSLKIGDFGMASRYPVPKGTEREGDREYIAPEVLSKQQYGTPADIFSLGIMMLEVAANIVLPDYGVHWQKLRSGDLSDAGRLSSGNLFYSDDDGDVMDGTSDGPEDIDEDEEFDDAVTYGARTGPQLTVTSAGTSGLLSPKFPPSNIMHSSSLSGAFSNNSGNVDSYQTNGLSDALVHRSSSLGAQPVRSNSLSIPTSNPHAQFHLIQQEIQKQERARRSRRRVVRRRHGGSTKPGGSSRSGSNNNRLGRRTGPPSWAPKFMIDDSGALDAMVRWMLSPDPLARPSAMALLTTEEVRWVEERRKAGAVIYEGDYGPQPDSLDVEAMDEDVDVNWR